MALDVRFERVVFGPGRGRRTRTGSSPMRSAVREAVVALNGFKVDFTNNDHHINLIEVDVDFAGASGSVVNWRVDVQYADKNFDDNYTAEVQFVIIADVA